MNGKLTVVGLILAAVMAGIFGARVARAIDDTVIVIGGEEVLRIRADSGGFTARQRAESLRRRVLEIYQMVGKQGKRLTPADVTLDMTPGRPAVRVRGMLLLSVTQDDARVNGSSIEDLAKTWHARLRDALVKNAPMPEDGYPDDSQPAGPSPSPTASPSASPRTPSSF